MEGRTYANFVCVRSATQKTKAKVERMAIYHLSVKTISRSAGRSATAAAAYRAGVEIADARTGEVHDYRRKGGVEHSEIVLPKDAPDWARDRSALWNAAEVAEVRKNSTVAREFEIALPSELSREARRSLAVDFAREIVGRHGCAVDVAIHEPGQTGDNRNHHAHLLLSTRRLGPEGFTEKTRELDQRQSGEVDYWRSRYAELQNERLQEAGLTVRVDHRSLKAQGVDREPTRHLGPSATGYERRTGQASRRRLSHEAEITERLQLAKEAGELARAGAVVDQVILDLTGNLTDAIAERDRLQAARPLDSLPSALAAEVRQGMADFMAEFEQFKAIERGKAAAIAEFEAHKARNAPQNPKEIEQDVQKAPDRGPKLSR